jgi:hypothetical protein
VVTDDSKELQIKWTVLLDFQPLVFPGMEPT